MGSPTGSSDLRCRQLQAQEQAQERVQEGRASRTKAAGPWHRILVADRRWP